MCSGKSYERVSTGIVNIALLPISRLVDCKNGEECVSQKESLHFGAKPRDVFSRT